ALVADDGCDDVAVTTSYEAATVDVGKDVPAITHAATSVRLSAVWLRTTAGLSSGQFHEFEFSNMFEIHCIARPETPQGAWHLGVLMEGIWGVAGGRLFDLRWLANPGLHLDFLNEIAPFWHNCWNIKPFTNNRRTKITQLEPAHCREVELTPGRCSSARPG